MEWLYDGEPIRMDPETYYFLRVVDGGTSEGYREWLRAAIATRRLVMSLEDRLEREYSGKPAPIRA